jgi:hypothetical protein
MQTVKRDQELLLLRWQLQMLFYNDEGILLSSNFCSWSTHSDVFNFQI